MIFVTVGTHEQQFNRLVKYMDEWAANHDEDVVIQTGYSSYEPKHCKWQKLFSYQDMSKMLDDARLVITHGGPSSFIASLQIGKTPIVVPRKKQYDEHVNDHQVNFCREVEERLGSIIVVEDVNALADVIDRYDEHISIDGNIIKSNNAAFCTKFEKVVDELFEKKRGRKA